MTHRLTVDYLADYLLVRAAYDALWSEARPLFSMDEILTLLEAQPWIARLNEAYAGVNWYRHHVGALRTVAAGQTRPEPRSP
jgi:spore coat polysaccharide biosynthesis protein SpsF